MSKSIKISLIFTFFLIIFNLFIFSGSRSAAASTLNVTNAEKLSLATSTPIGQKVRISDGFVVIGAGATAVNGFYYIDGTLGGKNLYSKAGADHTNHNNQIFWEPSSSKWYFSADPESTSYYRGLDDVTEPWMIENWEVGDGSEPFPILSHPAVQELVAPSSAQGGVFVSGGSQDGIYTDRGEYNGKRFYNILGVASDAEAANATRWIVGGNNGTAWEILDSEGGNLYYSLSDVDTPDLAGTDKAMMNMSGGDNDGVHVVDGTFGGRPHYTLIGSEIGNDQIYWFTNRWVQSSDEGELYYSFSDVPTPDLATDWKNVSDDSPASITVTNIAWLNASDASPADISVTSITQGELDAGVTVETPSNPLNNHTFQTQGNQQGREIYQRFDSDFGGQDPLHYDTQNWILPNGDPLSVSPEFIAFPWQSDLSNAGGIVTRNDIASEANWQTILTDPTSLQFAIEPSNTLANTPITPGVTIKILDSLGHLVSSSTALVTLSLENGSGTLSGTLTKSALNGVATFDDLSLDDSDTYSLHATSDELTDAISSSFFICGSLQSTLDVTNSEKLSLTNVCPGQKVRVSDGFVVSGINYADNSINGFYAPNGTHNGKNVFTNPKSRSSFQWSITGESCSGNDNWEIVDNFANAILYDSDPLAIDNPMLVQSWASCGPATGAPVFTHPVIQELTAPSAAQGGVFVSGGTQDGVYSVRGSNNGKSFFNLLGQDDEPGATYGITFDGSAWRVGDGSSAYLYYSLSDVATPDLATDWKNSSDDTSASITVTSVTQGELDAGVTVEGAGTSGVNGLSIIIGAYSGRQLYAPDFAGAVQVLWNPNWAIFDGNGSEYESADNTAFPWGASFTATQGTSPPPIVTRNNIAAEANWQVVSATSSAALSFNVEPANAVAGSTISPGVTVRVLDSNGDLVSNANDSVILSLGTNPSSGTLSGTLIQSAVAGVATFSDLSINNAGTGYTLLASAGGLTSTTSTSFNITAVSSGGGGSSGGGTVTTSVGGGSPSAPANTSPILGCPLGFTCTPNPPSNCPLGYTCTPTNPNSSNNSSNNNPIIFTRDLTIGSEGADVKALQIYLNTHGFPLASTGPGSKGNETNHFGTLTKLALSKFQKAHGISPALGYFGPVTRRYINTH